MKKILICGANLTAANRGVQALGYGAIDIIRTKTKQNFSFIVSFISPGESKKTIQKNVDQLHLTKFMVLSAFINYFSPIKFLRKNIFSESDITFSINEGDSYSDIYGMRRFLAIWIYNQVAIIYGKIFIFLPQTIGPFSNNFAKRMAIYQLKKVTKIFIRDEVSKIFLHQNNISSILIPDMAIFMNKEDYGKIILPKKFIIINPSGLLYYNKSNNFITSNGYQVLIKRIIDYLLSKNINIVLLPHVYSKKSIINTDDLSAAQELFNEYKKSGKIFIISNDLNAKQCKAILSKSTLVIASRMHACIGALSSNIPAIGLAYSYKFKGTFENFEMEKWVIELNVIKNPMTKIRQLINMAINNSAKHKKFLKNKNSILRKNFMKDFIIDAK